MKPKSYIRKYKDIIIAESNISVRERILPTVSVSSIHLCKTQSTVCIEYQTNLGFNLGDIKLFAGPVLFNALTQIDD